MRFDFKPVLSSLLAPTLLMGTLATTLAACPDREVAAVDPRQNREQEKEIPVQVNRDIDILFVVDNSGSMREEQDSLAANFSRFVEVLENIEGGLPNVHMGVVSTDVGAGPYGIQNCEASGDNGALQAIPQGACSGPGGQFIEDIEDEGNPGTRIQNYSGSLADTFSCIAQLGTSGCGFEQPLESMKRALNGTNAQNNGFLRDNAFLAVILITDEDDCSVENTAMFDTSQDSIDSELGFLSSFRCFEFGVQCEPDTPRVAGPRQNCVPRTDSPYMTDVAEYVNFLKSLKDDPGQIIVAGIIGDPTPVNVALGDGEPELTPSCGQEGVPPGAGYAGVRLKAFLDSFPNRSTLTTICNEDLSGALIVIGELLAKVIGNPCIEGDLKLTDGRPECVVADVTNLNEDGQEESIIPLCNDGRTNVPCYFTEVNTEQCSGADYPTQLTLNIERGNTTPPNNTTVVARCVAN